MTPLAPQYTIRSAGCHDSTLAATGTPVGTVYPTLSAAMRELARVIPGDTARLFADMVAVESCDGSDVYVYLTDEDADADDTGESALAVLALA